jgi:hypothetical protein
LWLSTDDGGVGNEGMIRMVGMAMAMAMAMGVSSRLREVEGGCVIVPSGNQEEEELCCGHAHQLTCTIP